MSDVDDLISQIQQNIHDIVSRDGPIMNTKDYNYNMLYSFGSDVSGSFHIDMEPLYATNVAKIYSSNKPISISADKAILHGTLKPAAIRMPLSVDEDDVRQTYIGANGKNSLRLETSIAKPINCYALSVWQDDEMMISIDIFSEYGQTLFEKLASNSLTISERINIDYPKFFNVSPQVSVLNENYGCFVWFFGIPGAERYSQLVFEASIPSSLSNDIKSGGDFISAIINGQLTNDLYVRYDYKYEGNDGSYSQTAHIQGVNAVSAYFDSCLLDAKDYWKKESVWRNAYSKKLNLLANKSDISSISADEFPAKVEDVEAICEKNSQTVNNVTDFNQLIEEILAIEEDSESNDGFATLIAKTLYDDSWQDEFEHIRAKIEAN